MAEEDISQQERDESREIEVEARAMRECYAQFEKRRRKPLDATEKFLTILGCEFWLMGTTAIAVTVLTALRTGTAFFTAAVGKAFGTDVALQMGQTTGGVEAVAAVLAYEGLLLGIGIRDGKNRYRKSYTEARLAGKESREIVTDMNPWFKWGSVGLALFTSMTAGFMVSANLIPNLDPKVREVLFWVLAFLMVLASVLAFTTGELLGMMYEEANVRVDISHDDYAQELKAWEKEREDEWIKNRTKFMARIDPKLVADIRARNKGQVTNVVIPQQPERAEITMPQAVEVLTWWLKKTGKTLYDEISSKEIAEAALKEAYKGTGLKPPETDINTLASSIRMALSRERKKAGNGNGHVTAEIE